MVRLMGEPRWPRLLPEALETATGHAGIVRRVLGVPVAEIVLHGPQIGALVCQVVTARMPQHVGPYPAELRLLPGKPDDVIDSLPGQLRLSLRDEQPGQAVLARGEIPLDGAQLVAGHRVLDAE